jgi:hypothetical protein
MRIAFAAKLALVSALAASAASAQSETPQPRKHHQNSSQSPSSAGGSPTGAPPIVVKRNALVGSAANAARERMNAGDCAGALDKFDQALEEQRNEPTLYRDRGSCHDRLGQPYPAIEDYRSYLTMAPDAPDADAVRGRLERLQDQVAGRSAAGTSEGPSAPEASAPSGSSADEDTPPKENAMTGVYSDSDDGAEAGRKVDKVKPAADDGEIPRSSLRADRGWALAPFVAARKWFRDGRSFGDGETWAECIGGQLRYSLGARGAILLEAGYERFDTTDVDVETVSGLTSLLELELRFPLNARYDDQLLLSPGLGYEYLSYSPGAGSNFSEYTEGAITARLRISYRHMLAEAVALDVSIDGGFAQFFRLSNAAADSHASSAGLAGLNVAFLWGL